MKDPSAATYGNFTYYEFVKSALPAMLEAEKYGARCAEHFIIFLNAAKEPAPNSKAWSRSTYLKARKCLHKLGLAATPLDYQSARDNRIGHDQRRAELRKRLARAGEEYRLRNASDDMITFSPLSKMPKNAFTAGI